MFRDVMYEGWSPAGSQVPDDSPRAGASAARTSVRPEQGEGSES